MICEDDALSFKRFTDKLVQKLNISSNNLLEDVNFTRIAQFSLNNLKPEEYKSEMELENKNGTLEIRINVESTLLKKFSHQELLDKANRFHLKNSRFEGKLLKKNLENRIESKLVFRELQQTLYTQGFLNRVFIFINETSVYFQNLLSPDQQKDSSSYHERNTRSLKLRELENMKKYFIYSNSFRENGQRNDHYFNVTSLKINLKINGPQKILDEAVRAKCRKKIDYFENEYRKRKQKEDKLSTFPEFILRKIKFPYSDQKESQLVDEEGNFGQIFKVKCSYEISLMSLNRQTNQEIGIQNEEMKIEEGNLIIKKPPLSQNLEPYFDSEILVLKFLKNRQCQQIGAFFIEEVCKNSQKIKKLYSRFYSNRLDTRYFKNNKFHTLSEKNLLIVLYKMICGLLFLWKTSVLHRDLKPKNIMLDYQIGGLIPKIIDFGSAYPKSPSFPQSELPKELATTKGYNMKFNELPLPIREKFAEISQKQLFNGVQNQINSDSEERKTKILKEAVHIFHTHQFFDLYAFGTIIEKLMERNLERIESSINFSYPIRKELTFISQTCKSSNPFLRFDPLQIFFLLYNVKSIFFPEGKS